MSNKNPSKPHQFKKGQSGNPAGRKPGTQIVVTKDFREAVRQLLDDCGGDLAKWVADVAEKNPYRAVDMLTKLAEFATPKLTRTEVSGTPGGEPVLVKRLVDNIPGRSALGSDSGTVLSGTPSDTE